MRLKQNCDGDTPSRTGGRFGSTAIPSLVAGLLDRQIHEMGREELIALLSRVPARFLERRVKRRLEHFDEVTLRRLLFLCRRCECNLARLGLHRPVPATTF